MSAKASRMGRNPFQNKTADLPPRLELPKEPEESKFPWNLIRWLAIDLPAEVIMLSFKTVLVAQYAVKTVRRSKK